MRHFRGIWRWGLAAVAVWVVVAAAIGIVAMEVALHVGSNACGPEQTAVARQIAARNHADLEEVSVAAGDGVMLRGWLMRPVAGNGDAAILLHGVGDNRAGMLGNAEMLLGHGYTVLLPDARAHGASGDGLATYGVWEAGDVLRWFEWVRRTAAPHCIYGLGESMGGGELLRSLAEEPDFCAVVAESPFASFREAGYDRLGERFNAGPWVGRTVLRPAIEAGLLYARLRYGLGFDRDSRELRLRRAVCGCC